MNPSTSDLALREYLIDKLKVAGYESVTLRSARMKDYSTWIRLGFGTRAPLVSAGILIRTHFQRQGYQIHSAEYTRKDFTMLAAHESRLLIAVILLEGPEILSILLK